MMQEHVVARTKYFDYLRVFSSLSIMLVHVAAYPWYHTDVNTFDWAVLDVYKSLFRAPVIIFFMISGALFLGRVIPLKKLYGKYILRIAFAFIFWDVVYAVITYRHLGIKWIIIKLFNSNYHLWFLLALLGLYICTPLLKLIADNEKVLKYFLVLACVFTFLIPSIFLIIDQIGSGAIAHISEILEGHFYDMHLDAIGGYSFYFLAGFYLHNYEIKKIYRKVIYFVGAILVIGNIFLNIYFSRMTNTPQDTFHDVFMVYEMAEAIAIFLFFKYNVHGSLRMDKIILKVSSLGLGTYLVHDLVILGLDKFLGLNAMTFSPTVAVLVVGVITFAISTAISWILNKIPFFNKYMV